MKLKEFIESEEFIQEMGEVLIDIMNRFKHAQEENTLHEIEQGAIKIRTRLLRKRK
jgi:hypothetical protein